MAGQHAAHGPVIDYLWRVSQWGPWQHAYREFGEVTSEAICEHSSRTRGLYLNEDAARCPGCLVVMGEGLADRLGDRRPFD